ncbi:MAG: prepilin-type N-terminal cleavage/methylation domain-containing protein [Gammaproteobacteria bacterium]|nr:prepilin-type N-terminal cleavage/methylation domain-containing protein [Gammaproteobacteria bacterium]
MKRSLRSGYTLIELLVVLLILSLLAGLAGPRLSTAYDSASIAFERDDILAQISGLGYLAFQQDGGFDLHVYPLPKNSPMRQRKTMLELPEGWRLRTKIPIRYFANGACSGGTVFLQYEDREFRVQLIPPFCQARME